MKRRKPKIHRYCPGVGIAQVSKLESLSRSKKAKPVSELQAAKLKAAKSDLLLYAHLYARISTEQNDSSVAEHKLCVAAKAFVRAVDAIDPKLWEPAP